MYSLWIMLAFLLIVLIRTVLGPSVWDRILGMSVISTKLAIIIILIASVEGIAYILDFAIIYILFGFIEFIFITTFVLNRTNARRRGRGNPILDVHSDTEDNRSRDG